MGQVLLPMAVVKRLRGLIKDPACFQKAVADVAGSPPTSFRWGVRLSHGEFHGPGREFSLYFEVKGGEYTEYAGIRVDENGTFLGKTRYIDVEPWNPFHSNPTLWHDAHRMPENPVECQTIMEVRMPTDRDMDRALIAGNIARAQAAAGRVAVAAEALAAAIPAIPGAPAPGPGGPAMQVPVGFNPALDDPWHNVQGADPAEWND